MALSAGEAIETQVKTIGQPERQAIIAGTGQGQQLTAGKRQAIDRWHVLRLQSQAQTRSLLNPSGKYFCPSRQRCEQGAFANAVRASQPDNFTGSQHQVEWLGRRLLPAGDQVLNM